MSEARALHLLGTHALSCLEERVCSALDAWAASWLSQRQTAWRVQAGILESLPLEAEFTELAGATGRLWMRRSSEQADLLARALLGEEFASACAGRDAWCSSLLDSAQRELDGGLAQWLIGPIQATLQRQPEATLPRFGSGAVRFQCGVLGLEFIADNGILRHVSPRPTPHAMKSTALKPLAQAAQTSRLALSVSLGHAELDLAHLLALQPGDVLRLPTQLGDRLPVLVEGQPWAHGSLGKQGEHKAVQLVTP